MDLFANEGIKRTIMNIYDRLLPVFRDIFDDETLTLSPSTTAGDVDGWDSLAHIRLIVSVETDFGVKFSAADVSSLKNVGDFVALIEEKLTPEKVSVRHNEKRAK